jgi:dienelactone hydrolase
MGSEDPHAGHSETVLAYLGRLYHEHQREHACRATTPESLAQWQASARPALRRLIGLEAMEQALADHDPTVALQDAEDGGDVTRQLGHIESEPDVRISFWLLKPKGRGPFPLAVMPHGHEACGHDTYAGVSPDEAHRQRRIVEAQADVAVQATRRGFIAIAPNTRGFGPAGVPDTNGRHGDRDCRSQLIHCLLAGRTAIGERVWDMQRIIDWALTLPEVDGERVLMMGNSGGGVCTTYAAACDTRIRVAVPSCSFAPYVSRKGLVHHCDCNVVPGILRFGDFHDVAGLIAPRHLLIVNGRKDDLFAVEEVERAVAGVRAIYQASGHPERFEHRWGPEGHRFYSDLMWPVIERALGQR